MSVQQSRTEQPFDACATKHDSVPPHDGAAGVRRAGAVDADRRIERTDLPIAVRIAAGRPWLGDESAVGTDDRRRVDDTPSCRRHGDASTTTRHAVDDLRPRRHVEDAVVVRVEVLVVRTGEVTRTRRCVTLSLFSKLRPLAPTLRSAIAPFSVKVDSVTREEPVARHRLPRERDDRFDRAAGTPAVPSPITMYVRSLRLVPPGPGQLEVLVVVRARLINADLADLHRVRRDAALGIGGADGVLTGGDVARAHAIVLAVSQR
jgi:hypothetical protein